MEKIHILFETHSGLNNYVVKTGSRANFNTYNTTAGKFVLTINELKKIFKKKITTLDYKNLRLWYFPNLSNEQILKMCFINIKRCLNCTTPSHKDLFMEKIILEGCSKTIDYMYEYSKIYYTKHLLHKSFITDENQCEHLTP